MKKMIVDEKHAEMISDALREAQGKASARIIADYDDLAKMVETAKKRFDVPKCAYAGCILRIRVGAGSFPGAYKYAPMGTYVQLAFRKDGKAEILDIDRVNVEGGKQYAWEITQVMRDYIIASLDAICTDAPVGTGA